MPHTLRRFCSPKYLLGQWPKAGDLIEIDRMIYSDWALYYGDGDVIIVTCEDGKISEQKAEVSNLSLEDFANDSPVRVNNKEVPARARGLKPLPVEEILKNAESLLGQKVDYNYMTRNSEHYVTEWRFGLGWSDQSCVASGAVKMLTRSNSEDSGTAHLALMGAFQSLLKGSHPQPGTSPKRSSLFETDESGAALPPKRCLSFPPSSSCEFSNLNYGSD